MIRFFALHPTAANLLMVMFIAVGLASAPSVKRETFPKIPPTKVQVSIVYPGASAAEVESAVCRPVENAIDGIGEIKEVTCQAREGIAVTGIEMREGGDIELLLNDVKTEVEAIDTFPKAVEKPIVTQLDRRDFVVSVAVSGPMSAPDLKAYAEDLKDKMLRGGVISQINIKGFSKHQISIEIPALTLRQYGLSVAKIADIIKRQSIDLPAGAINSTTSDTMIRFADERRSAAAFENLIVVAGASGSEIRLGDIAVISDRFELAEDKIIVNGQRAALLEVTKNGDQDTLTVVDAVSRFIARQRQISPPGVHFELTQNISSIVRDRLNMLTRNGIQGLFLVFLTMWLFFGFRFSFWIAMGLPVSFMGTIFVMSVLGLSFDMITMVGLLIAVGLLMDDAIVLSENIATHISEGKSVVEAAVTGTKQVAPGVVGSYLTTIFVFGSLLFMKGHIGEMMKVLPIILIATLTVSMVEAFLILPHHLAQAKKGDLDRPPGRFRARFERGLEWVRQNVVGRGVDLAVEWRYLVIGLVIAMLMASFALVAGGGLKFRVFPEIDGNVIEARILLPQGTPLRRTEAVVKQITGALKKLNRQLSPQQPGGQSLVKNVNIQYGVNRDSFEKGPHVATISVDLLDARIRTTVLSDLLNRWRAESGEIADVIAVNFVKFRLGPAGRAIDIRLHGDSLERLKSASLELQRWLSSYRGVRDLSDDLRPGKPEILLRLRNGALALGVNASEIANQLRSAFYGKTVDEIQVGPESLEVVIRLAAADRDSLADLDYFTVTTGDGRQVPLSAVATWQRGRGWARIARVDGRRTVTIRGDVDTDQANTAQIIGDTAKRFLPGLLKRYPGLAVSYSGQAEEGATTGSSVGRGFILGLIGIFLLLSFLFRSYIEPLIVMAIIPMGLIGVIWGHYILGFDLSMPSIIGFVSLAGVIVNDSILLVHFIKIKRRQGMSPIAAAKMASRSRFRAVLLTSLTTIAGLLPIMAEQSLQAQVLKPLVASLTFGMTASTLLVLFVVPVIYTIFDDFGWTVALEDGQDDEKTISPPDRQVRQ